MSDNNDIPKFIKSMMNDGSVGNSAVVNKCVEKNKIITIIGKKFGLEPPENNSKLVWFAYYLVVITWVVIWLFIFMITSGIYLLLGIVYLKKDFATACELLIIGILTLLVWYYFISSFRSIGIGPRFIYKEDIPRLKEYTKYDYNKLGIFRKTIAIAIVMVCLVGAINLNLKETYRLDTNEYIVCTFSILQTKCKSLATKDELINYIKYNDKPNPVLDSTQYKRLHQKLHEENHNKEKMSFYSWTTLILIFVLIYFSWIRYDFYIEQKWMFYFLIVVYLGILLRLLYIFIR